MTAEDAPIVALFIDSPDPGGAETIVVNIACELQKASVPVEIWHFGNSWVRSAAGARGITEYTLDDRYYRRFYKLPLFAIYLSKVIRQRNARVVHSHLYGAVLSASMATLLAGVRHVGTLHDLYSLLDGRGRIAGLRLADLLGTHIVTVAEVIERQIRDCSRFGWRSLQTIHNGIMLPSVSTDQVGVEDMATTFVCVARLVSLKRIDLLIKAASKIDESYDFRIMVAGDGPEHRNLLDLIERLNLSGKVSLLGFRNDVEELLLGADCFVLPSSSEGLSCSIMEAMSLGLPVIATDVGGNAELVDHGKTGLLVSSGDTHALTSALVRIIESRDRAGKIGEAARQKIASEFSIGKMVDSYSKHYGIGTP